MANSIFLFPYSVNMGSKTLTLGTVTLQGGTNVLNVINNVIATRHQLLFGNKGRIGWTSQDSPVGNAPLTCIDISSGGTGMLKIVSDAGLEERALKSSQFIVSNTSGTGRVDLDGRATFEHFLFSNLMHFKFCSGDATNSPVDLGFRRGSAGILKVTDGASAYGNIDAGAFKVGGAAGVSFGPAAVTSITVVNGIVTAIS